MKPVFVTTVGSRLYGINTSSSDVDFKGYGFSEIDEIIGLKTFEQQEYNNQMPDGPTKIEGVIYDIRRYFHLCLKANPTVIEIAFANESFWTHSTDIGKEIAEYVRKHMLTQRLFPAYSAYHRAQMRKLQSMERTGKRKEEIFKFGFDTKFAGHAYRLARQCVIVLNENILRPTLDPNDVDMCLKIRRGEFSKEETLKILETVDKDMYNAHQSTQILKEPDFNKANNFVVDLYKNYIDGNYNKQLDNIFKPF